MYHVLSIQHNNHNLFQVGLNTLHFDLGKKCTKKFRQGQNILLIFLCLVKILEAVKVVSGSFLASGLRLGKIGYDNPQMYQLADLPIFL